MKRHMKYMTLLIPCLLVATCSDELPPQAPQVGRQKGEWVPPQEINEPGGGSGGGPTYLYTWMALPTVNTNYDNNPTGTPATKLRDFATGNEFDFTGTTVFRPRLVDQNSKADMLALAKAIYYGCHNGVTSCATDPYCQYNKVWHAVRSMMRHWYSGMTSTDDPICKNGWLGMSRNLMGYIIAADYLNSLGPIGSANVPYMCGGSPCNNQQTFDSLKTFVTRFRNASDLVRAPNTNDCTDRTWHLRYMGRPGCDVASDCTPAPIPTPANRHRGFPDNKGAAALASYLTVHSFYDNQIGPTNAWRDSAYAWYKAFFDHTYGHFRTKAFWAGEETTDTYYWHHSWNGQAWNGVPGTYGDTVQIHINPILGDPANNYSHPNATWTFPQPDLWAWTGLSGAPSEDVIRQKCSNPEIYHTIRYTSQMVQPNVAAPALLVDDHIAGTINYLINAAEIIYLEGGPFLTSFTFANNGPKRMIEFFDAYAARDDCSLCIHCQGNKNTACGSCTGQQDCPGDCVVGQWAPLAEQVDDWPALYIVEKRLGGVSVGQLNRSEGKQMSFTDLTHQ